MIDLIDRFFQVSAERLQIWLHEFQALPQDQKEILCLKLLLELVAIIFAVWLGQKVGHAGKRRSKRPKAAAAQKNHAKKWRTDGSYFDEQRQEWVGPDFK